MRRIDQLTFTRFLAALIVVFSHSGAVFPVNAFPFNPLLTAGQTAVSYFFVLSGFVMAIVYYRPGERFDVLSYWKARFTRLYPVYIFAFLITCLFYIDIMANVKTNKILANVFLVQAWFPQYAESFNIAAWSLSVEVLFYALFPFLAMLTYRLSTRSVIWLSLAVWVVSQILHLGLYHGWNASFPRHFIDFYPPVHLSTFMLGLAGGAWYLTDGEKHDTDWRANWFWILVSLLFVGAALIARETGDFVERTFSLDAGLLAPFFLIVILCLATDKTALAARLSHPRLVLLGDASYALYILHLPVRWIGERWAAAGGLPNSIFIYLYWLLIVILSVVVFVRIERPARDWLRQNFAVTRLMLVDSAIIIGGIYIANALRFGGNSPREYEQSVRFMARLGLITYLAALSTWRLYDASRRALPPHRMLIPVLAASGAGAAVLAAGMVLATSSAWIIGYPRSVILVSAMLIAALTFGVRAATPHFSRKTTP